VADKSSGLWLWFC